MSKKIADRLKELRGKASQAEIAKVVGRSAATVSNWENWENAESHSTPDAEALALLATHWNVSADYIIGRSDFRSGLAPDTWLIDLDEYETPTPGKTWAAKVPRRLRIVDYAELEALKASRGKKGK